MDRNRRFDGKVVLVTGAARGQGRNHAVRFAQEGARLVLIDACSQLESVPYPLATGEDLSETVRLIADAGGEAFPAFVDVRDRTALMDQIDAAVNHLGPIDVVVANAGIAPFRRAAGDRAWHDAIEVNLSGTYNTIEAALPQLRRGPSSSIIVIASTAGLSGHSGGSPGGLGYSASKHGIIGLMRNYANNLAREQVRVNAVLPTGVASPMVVNDVMADIIASEPNFSAHVNALPVQLLEPDDISNAVLWLASQEARYVTGITLPVDAGFLNN